MPAVFLGLNALELPEKAVQLSYAAQLYFGPVEWLTENFKTYDKVNPVWPGELITMSEFSGIFIFAIAAFSWIARAAAASQGQGSWRTVLALDAATCAIWGCCLHLTWRSEALFEDAVPGRFLVVPLYANMLSQGFFTLAFFFSFMINLEANEDDPFDGAEYVRSEAEDIARVSKFIAKRDARVRKSSKTKKSD